MLRLEDFVKIRELHFKDGWGVKKISRECGCARATIRKAIRDGAPQKPRYQLSKPRPRPVATPEVLAYVREISVANRQAPRKQRHTARRVFRRLCAEKPKWRIGESTVRSVVRQVRAELRERPAVTIPFAFEPGEEAQVDFGLRGDERRASEVCHWRCRRGSARSYAVAAMRSWRTRNLGGRSKGVNHSL